ncbi:MAG: hypothetical protein V1740_01960 [Candidatus Woesearchaeota archaeon]
MILESILYLLPGLFFTLLYFTKLDLVKLISLSIGLSISINLLASLILSYNLAKLPIILFLIIISLGLLTLVIMKKSYKKITNLEVDIKDLIVIIVLIFVFFLIFKVHYSYTGMVQDPHFDPQYRAVEKFNYPYPIHADEWSFLTMAISIKENDRIGLNPFTQKESGFNLETGSHLFLSELIILFDFDPIEVFQHFPAIFAVVNSLFLFLLVRKMHGHWAGIFSILFFASIQSNTNLLGNWFFTPLTFSLWLIFLFAYLLLEEKLWMPVPILIITILTYPPVFIINLFLLFISVLKKKKLMVMLIIFVFGGFIYLYLVGINPFTFIIFKKWTFLEIKYNLISFYGIVGCILALAGFYRKKYLILVTGFLLANVILFQLFDFSILIPYIRVFYYYLVSLTIASGIGLWFLIKKFCLKSQIKEVFAILIVIVLFAFQFWGYYEIEDRDVVLLHLIQDKHYDAMVFLRDNYDLENETVFTDALVGLAVYPITQGLPVAIQSSNLGFRPSYVNVYYDYFRLDCSLKKEMYHNSGIDIRFLLSEIPLDCEGMNLIYDEGIFVYEYDY